jgi:hypothetical protein
VIRYTPLRPFVLRLNDIGGSLAGLVTPIGQNRSSDAAVGGGSGGADV